MSCPGGCPSQAQKTGSKSCVLERRSLSSEYWCSDLGIRLSWTTHLPRWWLSPMVPISYKDGLWNKAGNASGSFLDWNILSITGTIQLTSTSTSKSIKWGQLFCTRTHLMRQGLDKWIVILSNLWTLDFRSAGTSGFMGSQASVLFVCLFNI